MSSINPIKINNVEMKEEKQDTVKTDGIEIIDCILGRKKSIHTSQCLDSFEEVSDQSFLMNYLESRGLKKYYNDFNDMLDILVPNLIMLSDVTEHNDIIKNKKDLMKIGIQESWNKFPSSFTKKYDGGFNQFYKNATSKTNNVSKMFLEVMEQLYQEFRQKIKENLKNTQKNHVIIVYGCAGHGKTTLLKIMGCVLNYVNPDDKALNNLKIGHHPQFGTSGISDQITITYGNIRITFLDVQGTCEANKTLSDADVMKQLRETNIEIDAILFVNKFCDGRYMKDQKWTFQALAYGFSDIGPEIFKKVIPVYSRVNTFFEENIPVYEDYIEDRESKQQYINENYGEGAIAGKDYEEGEVPKFYFQDEEKVSQDSQFLKDWTSTILRKMNSDPEYSFEQRKRSCIENLKNDFDELFNKKDLWTPEQMGGSSKEIKKKELWEILKNNIALTGWARNNNGDDDFHKGRIDVLPDFKLHCMVEQLFHQKKGTPKHIAPFVNRYKIIRNFKAKVESNWSNNLVRKIMDVASEEQAINLKLIKTDFFENQEKAKIANQNNIMSVNSRNLPMKEEQTKAAKKGVKKMMKNVQANFRQKVIVKTIKNVFKKHPIKCLVGAAVIGGACAAGGIGVLAGAGIGAACSCLVSVLSWWFG